MSYVDTWLFYQVAPCLVKGKILSSILQGRLCPTGGSPAGQKSGPDRWAELWINYGYYMLMKVIEKLDWSLGSSVDLELD